VAGGTDQITFSWSSDTDAGSEVYTLMATDLNQAGLAEANRVLDGGDGGGGIVVALDLGSHRFEPGELGLTLQRGQAAVGTHGVVEVRARYVHGPADIYDPRSSGLWDHDTVARCSW
jgi:hypothetical protein